MADGLLFEIKTPLGFHVRVTQSRWNLISQIKHPIMAGKELAVRTALENPDEVRQSRSDPNVFLFYKSEHRTRWVCAVAKQQGKAGLLITAYPTDRIKEGVKVWPK